MSNNPKVLIRDIAQALGLSSSTVSRALQDNKLISDATKKLIKEKAQQMNYRPNMMARNLKTGKTNTIAVLVPSINSNFFSSVIEGVEDEAYKRGYDVLICQNKDDKEREKRILSSLSMGKIDGLIASIALPDSDLNAYEEFSTYDIPMVFFDRASLNSSNSGSVKLNNYMGAFNAVEHLISQGNKKIFHLAGTSSITVWEERYRGWRDALLNSGIESSEHWLYRGKTSEKMGQLSVDSIIEFGDIPDAIFCANDYTALGVISQLKAHGIKVPEDISVFGFSNEPIVEISKPTISSVSQSSFRMGSLASNMLLNNLIDGNSMDTILIDPIIKIRESSLYTRTISK